MKLVIITHVSHRNVKNNYFGYAPYVREMNIWLKYVNSVKIVAPLNAQHTSRLIANYHHKQLEFEKVPQFSLLSIINILNTIFKLPFICFKIYKSMFWADHIHLRCPGNMGLLASVIQIFFPSKPKTVKYAGNWDPESKQPWSYRLQKWIVSNTILSKNIKVLVYGEWSNQTKNILPFFTASFSEKDIEGSIDKDFSKNLIFLFVGSLVEGKQPFLAIRLVEQLRKNGKVVRLKIYGEGPLKAGLEHYIESNNLNDLVKIYGGISLHELKKEYKKSHFSILPSKSEGWPKAVAEAMFFGCIPIATKVSCVPWMLGHGDRGILLSGNLNADTNNILKILDNTKQLKMMTRNAMAWSQNYTLEYFEKEIIKLL